MGEAGEEEVGRGGGHLEGELEEEQEEQGEEDSGHHMISHHPQVQLISALGLICTLLIKYLPPEMML